MASSGKKKTTMAKLARETRLRERRLNKQAKKDARKLAGSAEHMDPPDGAPNAAAADGAQPAPGQAAREQATPEQAASDPVEDKDSSLRRLREAPDEVLALFEGRLREDAVAAGATEQELREAQSGHPGHD